MTKSTSTSYDIFLRLLNEYHQRSGLTLHEAAVACDVDTSYVQMILRGNRRPQRDVIIAMATTYGLQRVEIDELLLLAEMPPLGRSALRAYRREKQANLEKGSAS